MFSRGESGNRNIDVELHRAFSALRGQEVGTQDYVKILNIISTLSEMKEAEKPSKVSRNTMAEIAANLVGILLIINHENVNVITSRAFSLLYRLR